MKTLLIMRHAKSSWANDTLADHDRPLNDRGRHDAPLMGRFLAAEGLTPDLIICSSARRARQTAEAVAEAAGYDAVIAVTRDLYQADPDAYLAAARAVDDGVSTLLLVGHNPEIEELVAEWGGVDEPIKTATVACFRIAIDRWAALDPQQGVELVGVWRPKEL